MSWREQFERSQLADAQRRYERALEAAARDLRRRNHVTTQHSEQVRRWRDEVGMLLDVELAAARQEHDEDRDTTPEPDAEVPREPA